MKNLEKEYKEAIKNETPDLWSRIEAGIDAYEASKKETAPETVETPATTPVTVGRDNVVNFRFKKAINIIGKISVAAVIVAAVAVTINVTRTGRKSYSPGPAAEATMDDSTAEESTHTYSPSEEASKPIDLLPPVAEAESSESPIMNGDTAKEESPSLIIDSPSKRGEDAAQSDASPSFEADDEAVTVKSLINTFDIGNLDAIRFLSELNNLGLTDIRGLTVTHREETDSSVYGFETDEETFSIASFTAGSNRERYLLFYSADTDSGIRLLAVKKDDENGAFIYSEK
jgi:hypothetical protein